MKHLPGEIPSPIPVAVTEPIVLTDRRRKRWPIAAGALAGVLLPLVVELGILGPQLAAQVRDACLVVVSPHHDSR
jgi:hypothetical protein